jgi:hypothetical protein
MPNIQDSQGLIFTFFKRLLKIKLPAALTRDPRCAATRLPSLVAAAGPGMVPKTNKKRLSG